MPAVSPMTMPMPDAYAPAEVAERVRDIGVKKATAPASTLFALAVLAGAFIALGALFFTVTVTAGPGQSSPFGLTRLIGGVAFSLGLILVVVGGAELLLHRLDGLHDARLRRGGKAGAFRRESESGIWDARHRA